MTVTAVALLTFAIPTMATSAATDDVFARSRVLYASLGSYADSGAVEHQYGQGGAGHDRHTFRTYFSRAPRGFYFEFNKNGGADRYVIWGDQEAFHTWWKTTGVKADYPNPHNTGAFSTADPQTAGSAMKIPPLLYAKAGLQGAVANLKDPTLQGTEEIGGRRSYRLVGKTGDLYGQTGREVNVRKVTVWIDAQSLLIRKVLEEPKDTPPGYIERTTTTFEPQANPVVDQGRFRFTPPGGK